MAADYVDVDDYLRSFPDDVRDVLEQVRATIRGVLPDADEVISYGIPTFKVDGRAVVHFAGWKHDISLYPQPVVDGALAAEVEPFVSGKGTVKFPLSRPVPYDLVARLVTLLAAQRT